MVPLVVPLPSRQRTQTSDMSAVDERSEIRSGLSGVVQLVPSITSYRLNGNSFGFYGLNELCCVCSQPFLDFFQQMRTSICLPYHAFLHNRAYFTLGGSAPPTFTPQKLCQAFRTPFWDPVIMDVRFACSALQRGSGFRGAALGRTGRRYGAALKKGSPHCRMTASSLC